MPWLAALVLALLPAREVRADEPGALRPTPEALAEGKGEFERGVALLQDARYAEAVAALERSVAVLESPSALYNLALAYRGVGAYRRAIAKLERFLALATDQHDQLRTGATRLLAELAAGLGHLTLEVRGAPESATVDGAPIGLLKAGERLAAQLELDPGRHEVVLVRHGFRDVREVVTLQPGEKRTITLEAGKAALAAELVVEADVETAVVRVDGAVRGAGALKVELAPGEHVVEVSADGFEPEARKVVLEPGARERLTLALTKRSSSVLARWWFWAGAVAVVGAAVAGAVVLARPSDPVYDGGTFGFTLQN